MRHHTHQTDVVRLDHREEVEALIQLSQQRLRPPAHPQPCPLPRHELPAPLTRSPCCKQAFDELFELIQTVADTPKHGIHTLDVAARGPLDEPVALYQVANALVSGLPLDINGYSRAYGFGCIRVVSWRQTSILDV